MRIVNVQNGFAHGDYGSLSNVETAQDAKYDLNNIDIIGSSQTDVKNNATEVNHAYGKKFKFPLDNKDIRSEIKPKSIGSNSLFGQSQRSVGGSPRIEEYRKIK